jgi:hypothetical protein
MLHTPLWFVSIFGMEEFGKKIEVNNMHFPLLGRI